DTQANSSETHGHVEAATDAQSQADAAVAAGDYEAASHYRETAENEAWAAGDQSVLHGSSSTDLDDAHWQQQQADYYEHQESLHVQAGGYEAAREDASNAAWHNGNADFNAGGPDHTGQANAEYHQEDWAVWEQHAANDNANSADVYAAQGDFD